MGFTHGQRYGKNLTRLNIYTRGYYLPYLTTTGIRGRRWGRGDGRCAVQGMEHVNRRKKEHRGGRGRGRGSISLTSLGTHLLNGYYTRYGSPIPIHFCRAHAAWRGPGAVRSSYESTIYIWDINTETSEYGTFAIVYNINTIACLRLNCYFPPHPPLPRRRSTGVGEEERKEKKRKSEEIAKDIYI